MNFKKEQVNVLTKINALVKYEMINLRRGKLVWIIAVLYIFGLQQVISNMFSYGNTFLSLRGLIENSWLPLNLIMIPLLLLNMNIGESENDIFKTLDMSSAKIFISKVVTSSIIGLAILFANVIVAVSISLLCKVSMSYFTALISGYIANTLIFLITISAIGLFAGQIVTKYLGEVFTCILLLITFIVLSNFYKTFNLILPLIGIRCITSSIDVIIYDKCYLYHNLFWILITAVLFMFTYYSTRNEGKSLKAYFFSIAVSMVLVSSCVYLGIVINEIKPDFYDIVSRKEVKDSNYSGDSTFFSDDNVGFTVDEYTMDINIDNGLENTCDMKLNITNDKISSLKLGLYKGLNISKVLVDGKPMEFKRTNNNFEAILERKYSKGESIEMQVVYSGMINTNWVQGRELFYVRNNGIFLADVFEWYPKLNDSIVKDYTVKIKYNFNNKIYSNIEETISGDEYTFKGQDREIFLISSPLIKERTYGDHLIIGNEELVNNDKLCNDVIMDIANNNEETKNIKKLIYTPLIPGISNMDQNYIKAYLFGNF